MKLPKQNESYNFNFLSNNAKGMQSSKKCLRQFENFKSKLKPSGLLSYMKRIPPLIAKKVEG